MAQYTKCEACRTGFFYSNEKSVDIENYPIARIMTFDNNEGQEKIQHPNKRLFHFLQKIEKSFAKNCKYSTVFELVVNDVTDEEFEYSCSDAKRTNAEKKKASKLTKTFFFLMRRKNGKIFYRRCTGLS